MKTLSIMIIFATGAICADVKLREFTNQTLDTPAGQFSVNNLRAKRGGVLSPMILTGSIVNNTKRDWTSFRIGVTPSDGSHSFQTTTVTFYGGLKKDAWEAFNYTLTGKINFENISFAISFQAGDYAPLYKFEMVKPVSGAMRFADESTEWTFAPSRDGIGFELVNKSDKILKLDWNSSTLVDQGGTTHKVAGSGIRYMDINSTKTPSIAPPGARIQDEFFPTDMVKFASTWYHQALFPSCPDCRTWEGKLFSLYAPVDIGGTSKDYLFQFRVVSVE